ncbi:uncharacterized protein LOC129595626 [Paramacrobiotus metropolitanus]|uniref:uncharacterized protein LOC129595626 n=1 Tax=Paramacrobiotus metropolitanus TaxID=2943436 RepID=UPI0024464F0D|nr:uncharacterized protein LOC129595626 [Paramacrobiotus metropolitanus]
MKKRLDTPESWDKCTPAIICTCDTCGKSTFRHGPLHDGKLCAQCAAASGKRSHAVSMLFEPQNFPPNAGNYLRRKKHRTQGTTATSARASSSRANVIGTTRAHDEHLENENLPSARGAKDVPAFPKDAKDYHIR